jgi:hypothetical protein
MGLSPMIGKHALMQHTPARKKTGRKPLPPRTSTGVYLPVELRSVVESAAERAGLALSPYLVRLIAEAHGMEAPVNCYPKNEKQEELPLSKAS